MSFSNQQLLEALLSEVDWFFWTAPIVNLLGGYRLFLGFLDQQVLYCRSRLC